MMVWVEWTTPTGLCKTVDGGLDLQYCINYGNGSWMAQESTGPVPEYKSACVCACGYIPTNPELRVASWSFSSAPAVF